jgi:sulfite reductase alpha subunit-like flavoprotein
MHVAFSREQPGKKVYVQHLLQQQASELRTLIVEQNASIYVCGEAKRMAKDVFNAVAQIVAEHDQFQGNVSNAEIHLRDMKKSSRWLEDVW